MSLPLLPRPWLLAPDDVVPYQLVNRRGDDMLDSQVHLGVEHTRGAHPAGAHQSIQIARAVCSYRLPSDYLSGSRTVRVSGVAVGFVSTPQLYVTQVGGAEAWFLDFETVGELVACQHYVSLTASTPYSAAEIALAAGRLQYEYAVRRGRNSFACRIWLGDRAALAKMQHGTLVAHCATPRSG